MNNYPDFLIYIASVLWGEVKSEVNVNGRLSFKIEPCNGKNSIESLSEKLGP